MDRHLCATLSAQVRSRLCGNNRLVVASCSCEWLLFPESHIRIEVSLTQDESSSSYSIQRYSLPITTTSGEDDLIPLDGSSGNDSSCVGCTGPAENKSNTDD